MNVRPQGPLDDPRQAHTIDPRRFAPNGAPWCWFTAGSTDCANGERCLNPNHRPARSTT